MKNGNRETFLDWLRVVATAAVVLLHTVTGIKDTTDMSAYPAENRIFILLMDLTCWAVPVFLLISGYLFLNPERKVNFREMLTKYCRRIVLALFLFGVPFAWMELIGTAKAFQVNMLWKGVWMVLTMRSWSHLWYLYLILLLYLLTPALKWILARVRREILVTVLSILFIVSSVLPFLSGWLGWNFPMAIADFGIFFFYYICGYLFVIDKKNTGDGTEKEAKLVLGGHLAVLLVIFMVMFVSRLALAYTFQMAYNYPLTVLLALTLFSYGSNHRAKQTEGKTPAKLLLLSEMSFTIYLIHPLFLNIYYKFLHLSPLGHPIGVALPLFYLAILLPSMVTAFCLIKIPTLKKWVL